MTVRVIALGSLMSRDDGAALIAARALEQDAAVELIAAGRPGPGLLDLLLPERPTVLMDVVRRGAVPGRVLELELDVLAGAGIAGDGLSSHGLGVADAFRLAVALDRVIPPGRFVGIGGLRFDPGDELSPDVRAGIGSLVSAARAAVRDLEEE